MGSSIPTPKLITPNWLKVERATIFFTSISNKALNLAIIFIIPPIKNRKLDPLQVKILKNDELL